MSLKESNKPNAIKTITCHICGKTLMGGQKALRQHLSFHEKERKAGIEYKCIDCDEIFNDKICYIEHRSKEHPGVKEKFECNICGKTFLNQYLVKIHHETSHDRQKTEKCEICGDIVHKSNVKTHAQAHEKTTYAEPKKCFYCEEKIADWLTFRAHIHENHKENVGDAVNSGSSRNITYKCGECDYSSAVYKLEIHYRNKHTIGGYIHAEMLKCHHCPIEFHERSDRDFHVSNHFDFKGNVHFNCHDCPLKFETPEAFAAHYQEHYAKRPYKCRFCPRRMLKATFCIIHENTKHKAELLAIKQDESDGLSADERRNAELRGWLDMVAPGPERDENNKLAYICDTCDEKCYGSYRFRLHLDKHREETLECQLCDYKTNRICHINRHMKTHSDIRLYVCKLCGCSFKDIGALRQHEKVHANKKHCKCNDCEKEFEDEYTYSLHLKEEHGGRYKCTFCDLKFISSSTKVQHEQTAHPEELSEECKICGEKFKFFKSLGAHLKTHEPSAEKCVICEKEFNDEYSLVKHANAEHDGSRFKCFDCGFLYKIKPELTRHRKVVHNEIVPKYHEISSDGLSTTERSFLENHGWMDMIAPNFERNAENQLAFICKHCGKKVFGNILLKKHFLTHGEGKFKCNICDYATDGSTALERHMKKHDDRCSYCSICDIQFKLNLSLTYHNRAMHEPKVEKCLDCNKELPDEYSFLQHIKKHVGYKRYKCSCCGKRFTLQRGLDSHQLKVHKGIMRDVATKNKKLSRDSPVKPKVMGTHEEIVEGECMNLDNEVAELKKDILTFPSESNAADCSSIQNESQLTPLPLSSALLKELLNNTTSFCLVWTRRIESDILSLAASHPTRCVFCVIENKTTPSELIRKVGIKLKKVDVTFTLQDKSNVTVAFYSVQPLQLKSVNFLTMGEFEDYLRNISNKPRVVHFMRENSSSSLKMLREMQSQTVVCNCVQSRTRRVEPE